MPRRRRERRRPPQREVSNRREHAPVPVNRRMPAPAPEIRRTRAQARAQPPAAAKAPVPEIPDTDDEQDLEAGRVTQPWNAGRGTPPADDLNRSRKRRSDEAELDHFGDDPLLQNDTDIRAQIRAAALNRHPERHSSVGFKWEQIVDSILNAVEDGDSDDGEKYVLNGWYSGLGSKRHRRIGGGKRYAHAGLFRAEHRNGRYSAHVKGLYTHAMHKSTRIGHEVRVDVSACSLGVQYGHRLGVSLTGPYAGAEAQAKWTGVGGGLYAGKVSARAGPITVNAGYDIDTEGSVGLDGIKLKVLGNGINIRNNGVEANVLGIGYWFKRTSIGANQLIRHSNTVVFKKAHQ